MLNKISNKKVSLKSKITFTNILLMTIMLITTMTITLKFNMNIIEKKLEANLLNISKIIAKNPMVIDDLNNKEISSAVERYLDDIIVSANDIDVIVIADNNGKRYYHPNEDEVGKKFVGGDEKKVLGGEESYISEAEGSLGKQKRAFFVIKNKSGEQLGFIMISTLMENINKLKIEMFKIYIILAAFIFSVGIVVSLYLSRNIKISLLGHEPYKFTKMYMQRKEVVDSLEEGIIAVDENGKIIIFNKAAINMLDIRKTKNIEGKFINDIFSKSKLVNIIQSGESRNNEEIIIKDIIIISNGIPIIENNKVIGAVTILRNKTEVTRLAEELTGVNQIIDSLRSNTHEFMNKLHVILGLIQIGKTEDAKSYIMNIREEQSEIVSLIIKKIKDPTIAALIIGKISRAKEMGIKLNLNPNSYFNMNDNLISRNSLVTIIGNLIENSIDSINEKDNDFKNISLLIYNDENSLLITIDDTGNGISSENLKRIYDKGFSTKGKNRGVGMYIIKSILDNYGGEIVIESEEEIGTCIEIRISKVL